MAGVVKLAATARNTPRKRTGRCLLAVNLNNDSQVGFDGVPTGAGLDLTPMAGNHTGRLDISATRATLKGHIHEPEEGGSCSQGMNRTLDC